MQSHSVDGSYTSAETVHEPQGLNCRAGPGEEAYKDYEDHQGRSEGEGPDDKSESPACYPQETQRCVTAGLRCSVC